MATIYRVQNEQGNGPYQADRDELPKWDERDFQNRGNHPPPDSDFLLKPFWFHCKDQEDYRFAFKDEAQFLAWFNNPEWISHMHDAGFELVELEVEDDDDADVKNLIIGEKQVIYRHDAATVVEQFSLTKYFGN